MIKDSFVQINFMILKNLEIDSNNHSHYHQILSDTLSRHIDYHFMYDLQERSTQQVKLFSLSEPVKKII